MLALLCVCGSVALGEIDDKVLLDIGLTRVGNIYLLDLDQHLSDRLREILAGDQRNRDLVRQQASMQADIASVNADLNDWKLKVADLQAREDHISAVAKTPRRLLEEQIKAGNAQIKADEQRIEKAKSDQAALKPIDTAALSSKLADEMDDASAKYDQIGKDSSIQQAIAKTNEDGGTQIKLGPSAIFLQQLPRLRAARERSRGKVDRAQSTTSPTRTSLTKTPGPGTAPNSEAVSILRINLTVEDQETIQIDRRGLTLIRGTGNIPTGVLVNGVPWDVAYSTAFPVESSTQFLESAQFKNAQILEQSGRGTIHFSLSADSVRLEIVDALPSGADYSVAVAFPAK